MASRHAHGRSRSIALPAVKRNMKIVYETPDDPVHTPNFLGLEIETSLLWA
jgi:hypothetical protein